MFRGGDDDDLEGNWAAGPPEPKRAPAAAEVAELKGAKKKKKQKAPDADAVEPEPAKPTKRKRKAKEEDVTGGLQAMFEAPPRPEETEEPMKKKRKKKKRKKLDMAEVAAAGGADPRKQAKACLAAAWAALGEASRMSPLELKDFRPQATWFCRNPLDATLSRLPQLMLKKDAGPKSALRRIAAGAENLEPAPKGVSVTVLCSSAERVFEAQREIQEFWKVKPLVLAAHGGGRTKDQIARQGKAIAAGVSVAVCTPGRVLRLFEDGLIDAAGTEVVVVDMTKDVKGKDLLTMFETRRDLIALVRRHLLGEFGKDGGCRLVMCGGGAAAAA